MKIQLEINPEALVVDAGELGKRDDIEGWKIVGMEVDRETHIALILAIPPNAPGLVQEDALEILMRVLQMFVFDPRVQPHD